MEKAFIYNALSIWEVIFLYGWLFTRFEKSFGKIIAVLLTAISVGLYHTGTLPVQNILYLCVCVFDLRDMLFRYGKYIYVMADLLDDWLYCFDDEKLHEFFG